MTQTLCKSCDNPNLKGYVGKMAAAALRGGVGLTSDDRCTHGYVHNGSVDLHLHVFAEQYDSDWKLIDPASASHPEPENQPWVYRSDTLITVATGMPNPQFINHVEPVGAVGAVPTDLSPEVREMSTEKYDFAGAPCGHVAMGELLGFDWERTAIVQGRVSAEHAVRFKANEPLPDELAEVRGLLQLPQYEDSGRLVRWTDTYRDLAGDEFLATVHALAAVNRDTSVRLVYWAG